MTYLSKNKPPGEAAYDTQTPPWEAKKSFAKFHQNHQLENFVFFFFTI